MKKTFLIFPLINLFLFNCLVETTQIKREPAEATLIIIRDGGNSDDDINVYIDSFFVGVTKQNTITYIIMPAGSHYLFFENDDDFLTAEITMAKDEVAFCRQFFLDAHVFSYLKAEFLEQPLADRLLTKPTLAKESYAYYLATEKMVTTDFQELVLDFYDEKKVEISPGGIKIRIED